MAKTEKKPAGWRAFDALARKLVRVPKDETDKLAAERKAKKKRK